MSLYSLACDRLLGPCLSRTEGPAIHLTFDDGPVPGCTDRVLETLELAGVTATFFVITERAKQHRDLVRRIQALGHAIGDHSLDHAYRYYFTSERTLREWIHRSQEELTQLLGERPIGFRSPAGVRTPPLHAALRALEVPLIHWSLRFFDTAISWTSKRATSALPKIQPGSILLLHDSHQGPRAAAFAEVLKGFVQSLLDSGMKLERL